LFHSGRFGPFDQPLEAGMKARRAGPIVVALLLVASARYADAVPFGRPPGDPRCPNPTYDGADTPDHLPPRPTDDVMDGYGEDDTLEGGFGNDLICGGPGNDKLYGDEGNDVLIGGPGNDYCEGGTGDDVFIECETVVQDVAPPFVLGSLSRGRPYSAPAPVVSPVSASTPSTL
jgi:hemolysin type calcium-binding protein